MTRIKDIATTATTVASDDYVALDGTTNASRKILASNLFPQYAVYRHTETSGTHGQALTSGSWQTRTLNEEQSDTIGITLSSNEITVPAGTYLVHAEVPFLRTNASQSRLYNVTDAASALIGTNVYADNGADGTGFNSVIRGIITLASSKALRVEGRVTTSNGTNGGGFFTSWGTEIYTILTLLKIG